MDQDRFMTESLMVAVSRDLEDAGFSHVTSAHLINPKWRADYRPLRPELEPVAWTIRLGGDYLEMHQIKALIELCERHDLVFWMTPYSEETEFYVKIAKREAQGVARSQSI